MKWKITNHNNFIPMISIKLPNVRNFNYNTCIKIDDIGFKATNPGVWVHKLDNLTTVDKFTSWQEYENDETV